MILDLLHIAMIFVFLTVLLLITMIYSKIWWQLKAVLIVFSVFFYLSTYETLSSMLGRPTLQPIQDNARILVYIIEKPRGNVGGRIIMLVKDSTDFRLHQLPFTNEIAKKLREAERGSRQGGGIPKQMIFSKEKPTGPRPSAGDFSITLQQPEPPDKKTNDWTQE